MTHLFSSPFGLTVDVMSSSLSPIGHPAPAISMTPSNLKKERPHRGPPPPEPQSSQPENKGALPNEGHHVDPNTRPQKDASLPEPGPGASVGGPLHHSPRPSVGNHVEPFSSGNRPSHAEGTTGQTSGSTPNQINHHQGDILRVERALLPSSYESKTLPAVLPTQEGLSSRSSARILQEVHNESITKPGNVHSSSPCHLWAHRYLHL